MLLSLVLDDCIPMSVLTISALTNHNHGKFLVDVELKAFIMCK